MNAPGRSETDEAPPPPALPAPDRSEPSVDETVQLEERRRDAYRVG
jgi:hypothetical protein